MKIAIIGAMEEEISSIQSLFESFESKLIGLRNYKICSINEHQIILVISGIGKVAAASTVSTLHHIFGVEFIIFTGVAGSANSNLNIGDIVIAESLIQHDFDASPFFPKFEIPFTNTNYFKSSQFLNEAIHFSTNLFLKEVFLKIDKGTLNHFNITKPKCILGTIASGDQFISDASKINQLAQEINNLMCVEMEGAAVAQICHEYKIQFSILRLISDKADETAHVDFPKFIEKIASEYSKHIVENILNYLKLKEVN